MENRSIIRNLSRFIYIIINSTGNLYTVSRIFLGFIIIFYLQITCVIYVNNFYINIDSYGYLVWANEKKRIIDLVCDVALSYISL